MRYGHFSREAAKRPTLHPSGSARYSRVPSRAQRPANGRTTVLQGVIHLMLFAIYLFTTFVP